MRRVHILLAAAASAVLLAVSGQAAEMMGTVVSMDGARGTVQVRTPEGQLVTFHTDSTTSIQQGDTRVELTTLRPGAPVQIVATDVVTDDAKLVPSATRILIVPAKPTRIEEEHRVHQDDDTDVDTDTDTDDDAEDD